jgi:GNAT superfamily N-acetyltransferase
VLADVRGRGVGGALMEAAEAYALDQGARWLRIAVLAGNEGAWRLYKRHGFADRQVVLEKPLPGPGGA